jgi:hypothetical protein
MIERTGIGEIAVLEGRLLRPEVSPNLSDPGQPTGTARDLAPEIPERKRLIPCNLDAQQRHSHFHANKPCYFIREGGSQI